MMKLYVLFLLISICSGQSDTESKQTTNQGNCEVKLNECEQHLNPVYHQPEELLRSWQNCRVSLLEEKQRVTELENALNKKTVSESSCQSTTPTTLVSNSQKSKGVEGRWEQIVVRDHPPRDMVRNLDEGDLIAWPDYVARTWVGENTVPCRIDFEYFDLCWGWWDGKKLKEKTFEILVGNYKWVWTNSSAPIPNNALIGGYRVIPGSNNNREMLYVGRAIHDNFQNHNVTPNRLLLGHVHGQTRELVHVAWESTQHKTIYQILVKP